MTYTLIVLVALFILVSWDVLSDDDTSAPDSP